MTWTFDLQGGFICCSASGNYSYAYPTSPHAVAAKRNPELIALAMTSQADASALWLPKELIDKHNEYLRCEFNRYA